MPENSILEWLTARRVAMLQDLEQLVRLESPSRDKPALDNLARLLAARLEHAGANATIVSGDLGDHLLAAIPGENPQAKPVLLLGHFDTVWPKGTLAQMPWRVEPETGRAFGPGAFDMKSGLILIDYALQALSALNLTPPRSLIVLLTSDEEIGSPTSRPLIEEQARSAAYALVAEPPLPGGHLKTSRKGVGAYRLRISGRAAHAGLEPEKGISAIVELAHLILKLHALSNLETGSTVNVGLVNGGTAGNVVAASASAQIDARAWTIHEAQRLDHCIRALQPENPLASLQIDGGINRPPMERTPATAALFEQARQIGAQLGMTLSEGSAGGGSDGNFTAALGVPTLDGLGNPGAGAHAVYEHVLFNHLHQRAALLAHLILSL